MRSVAAALVLSLAVLAACSSEDDGSPGEEGSSGSSPTGQSPSESSRQSPSDVLTATSAPSDPKSATVTRTVASGPEATWGLDFLPARPAGDNGHHPRRDAGRGSVRE